jgi:hypothetical protein
MIYRPAAPAPAPIVGNGMLLWPVPGSTITQYYWASHPRDIASRPARR